MVNSSNQQQTTTSTTGTYRPQEKQVKITVGQSVEEEKKEEDKMDIKDEVDVKDCKVHIPVCLKFLWPTSALIICPVCHLVMCYVSFSVPPRFVSSSVLCLDTTISLSNFAQTYGQASGLSCLLSALQAPRAHRAGAS